MARRPKPLVALLRRSLHHADIPAAYRALRFAPRRVVSDALQDQLQVVVSADQIGGASGRIRSRFLFVAAGDWDCNAHPLDQTRAWRIMASIHTVEGIWWRSSELEPMLARVRQGYRGGRDYPMRTRLDVEGYFASRAELWRRCRKEGIVHDPRSPIRFAMGRDGVYLKKG